MSLRVRKPFVYLLMAVVLLGGGLLSFRYLAAFQLEEVSIAPKQFEGELDHLPVAMGTNLFSVPVDMTLQDLLEDAKVLRVDFDYDLPDGVNIKINEISPLALTLGGDGSRLYGLDGQGYVYHFDAINHAPDYPIITGLVRCRMYERIQCPRVRLALQQLELIKHNDMDMYQAISTMDFSNDEYIAVCLEGVPFQIKTYAGKLYRSMIQTRIFLSGFNPELDKIEALDLRSDGLIIAVK